MTIPTTTALVGATGGAGATRLTLELATALATDGRDVAVLDTAFATQGLSDYVSGPLDPDATALVTDAADEPLTAGLVDFDTSADGRVAVCPAAAPFERLARAMTPDAAQAFEGRIDEAAGEFDHVLVDAPLLTSNPTVAAATACDRVALVAPATARGADAVGRLTARVADIGTEVDAVVSTFGSLGDADAIVPETESDVIADAPACRDDRELAASIAAVASVLLDEELDSVTKSGSVLTSVGEYIRR
ncbi:ParA family protein [Haloferax mediterranei ATCC 33500]|uniref:Cell division inhibitor n=1 Tax=Haloferax mediterranei (strain ATCC 33500 / DSM 1411 / JCM 8866 / NBRC 14739 / NCIMB 2177 / R-4) TaxID=523841 RepID=I3R164_HALMT|nr:cell division inhibitor [Haloferax mediterranei]AFK17974.1 cell division inhibitor [Haloferax mediterranei ATCC 33500]AHZ22605.1 cell division inhibitor [Haloferax mediterranei ATCC 33500]EMA02749.1 cell division inhibitor [Haloferax mediterranei ATCC 33500]MDX5988066.1 ParA family protein [Haloferax mediterranei ATCC 33500]QCQ74525.1 ParA family protein [Haloferax mediterranei ATCC 33500]